MNKAPAFQFYPGDWMKDPELRSVSVEARGLWIDLLCLMFESSRKGHLQNRNGKPYSIEQLARIVGLDNQTANQRLTELLDSGVASVEPDTSVIYCRRMVKDAKLAEIRRNCGKLGGNPYLLNQSRSKPEPTPQPKRKQNPTPSSSSSSSSSSSDNTPYSPPRGDASREAKPKAPICESFTDTDDFEDFWAHVWLKVGKKSARKAYRQARKGGATHEQIMGAVVEHGPLILAYAQSQGITPVHPATWLNAGRWDDDAAAYNINSTRTPRARAQDGIEDYLQKFGDKESLQ